MNFKLASTVPDMTEYTNYTFKFTDTLSKGLTLNNTAATGNVRSDRQDRRYGTVVDLDYTAMYTKDTILVRLLEVNMMNFKNLHQNDAGKAITVEYSATLNKDAAGSNGNHNTAKISTATIHPATAPVEPAKTRPTPTPSTSTSTRSTRSTTTI